MRAEAFAKINFALAVFPPSADGYHPLRGIFQSVTIADEVAVLPANEDEVEVSNEEAPADESNLAWRAFEAVRGTVRVIQPSKVSITKRIPSGAGLGGGSADAAAVLGLTAARWEERRWSKGAVNGSSTTNPSMVSPSRLWSLPCRSQPLRCSRSGIASTPPRGQ